MAVGEASTHFEVVPGVRLAAAACGLKAGGNLDLVLMELAEGSTSAAVFTQNLFAAAPVLVGRRHLAGAHRGGGLSTAGTPTVRLAKLALRMRSSAVTPWRKQQVAARRT